eukprot:4686977-Ditylum_brightwellii.AAC.1
MRWRYSSALPVSSSMIALTCNSCCARALAVLLYPCGEVLNVVVWLHTGITYGVAKPWTGLRCHPLGVGMKIF